MEPVKQIIVIRKDLKTAAGERIRRGKEIAQGAHASMAWLSNRIREGTHERAGYYEVPTSVTLVLSQAEMLWLQGLFTKITCQVPDEAALRAIYLQALTAGLKSFIIEDAGLTEFGGVKTATAVGIGPDFASKIDPVCHHLPLY
jgi:PTH2 family peptidyl-tRNA hydrolase